MRWPGAVRVSGLPQGKGTPCVPLVFLATMTPIWPGLLSRRMPHTTAAGDVLLDLLRDDPGGAKGDGGARNGEGPAGPPDVEPLMRRLLARGPLADALYADGGHGQPFLDRSCGGVLLRPSPW